MPRSEPITLSAIAALICVALSGCVSGLEPVSQAATIPTERILEPPRISHFATSPDVTEALESIRNMNAKNIKRMIELTEIPAPPFEEEARAREMVLRLQALGMDDASIDEVGNVIARRRGTKGDRTIAVVAHIDTVFPKETDVTVRREGDTYYAPGIGDNSRGLVALLSLVEVMAAHDLETEADILFVASVGEEGLGDLRGVRHLFREGAPQIDSFIAIDGGSEERLVTTAVGSNRYRVTFSGPGGHSYGAFGRAHPHQALARAITDFSDAARSVTNSSGLKATFSTGRIGGGTSINSIPFESWMEVDMRSSDPKKLQTLDNLLRQAVNSSLATENKLRTRDEAMTVEIKPVGKRPAGQTEPSSSLVQSAMASLAHLGITPRLTASSTDANIPISLGIPSITMSRGGKSKNAHALSESWTNENAHLAIQAILLTLLSEAS